MDRCAARGGVEVVPQIRPASGGRLVQATDRRRARRLPQLVRVRLRELSDLQYARFDAKLEQRLAELKSDLVKWMFAFWAPTALAVVALLLRR